jgi:hypothetical protein
MESHRRIRWRAVALGRAARHHDISVRTKVVVADTTAQEAAIPHPNEIGLMATFVTAVVAAAKKETSVPMGRRPAARAAIQAFRRTMDLPHGRSGALARRYR